MQYTIKLAFHSMLVLAVFGLASVAQKPVIASKATPKAPEKIEEKKEKKVEDTYFHIKNVELHPVVGSVLSGTDILIKNGKIEAIGRDLEVPEDAKILDAKGLRAYPGLVSLNGDGILGGGSGGWKDRFDPFNLKALMGLSNGITTIVSRLTAVKLTYGSVDDPVLGENVYMGLFYSTSNPTAKKKLREDLAKAKTYLRDLSVYNAKVAKKDKTAKKPDEKKLGTAKRYLPLLQGQISGVFNIRDSGDLRAVCELAETYGFRPVVRGATEGWCVAGALGRAGATAVVTPRERRDSDPRLDRPNGSSIENAAILHGHGVKVAIASRSGAVELDGGAGQDALSLLSDVGFAIRGGLPSDAALRAVTLNAARVYGLDDRIGSLEIGKDADIILTGGDLLHYRNLVEYAFVNGKLCYDKSKEPLYAHIHSRDPEFKPTGQWWPRRRSQMDTRWAFDAAAWAKEKLDAEEKAAAEKKAGKAVDEKASKKQPKVDAKPTRSRRTRGMRPPRSGTRRTPKPIK